MLSGKLLLLLTWPMWPRTNFHYHFAFNVAFWHSWYESPELPHGECCWAEQPHNIKGLLKDDITDILVNMRITWASHAFVYKSTPTLFLRFGAVSVFLSYAHNFRKYNFFIEFLFFIIYSKLDTLSISYSFE